MKSGLALSAVLVFVSFSSVLAQLDEHDEVGDPNAKFGTVAVTDSMTLEDAVAQINKIAARHSIGKSQEPLTQDEVVSAIKRWSDTVEVSDETRASFNQIATTGELKAGDELQFATGLWSGGNFYTVWWIDLSVDNYTFRVRDRTISSRKMTDDEIAKANRFEIEAKELTRQFDRSQE